MKKRDLSSLDIRSFKAKKSLGQNFLKDKVVLEQIINELDLGLIKDLSVIEFGIGMGDLTKRLLDILVSRKYNGEQLVVYELDNKLISIAKENFRKEIGSGLLELRHKNILEFESKKEHLSEKGFFLVSNLPYYIASKIILNMLKDPRCKGFLVMTQKEVAEKFCAKVGRKDFCALSVMAESVGHAELCFDVERSSFYPEPKVMSSVFKFERKKEHLDSKFLDFLKICFSQPRKKLATNLKHYFELTNSDKRPHEISTEEYISLFERIKIKDEYGTKYAKQWQQSRWSKEKIF